MKLHLAIILLCAGLFWMATAGWATQVIVSVQGAQWLLLIAGAIVVPVGMVHGWGLWLGAWS
jgi:hypothetical protein